MHKTKVSYVNYLNESAPPYHSEKWIMCGVQRYSYANRDKFGDILRLYNPVAFEYGYSAWLRPVLSESRFVL